MAKNPAFLFYSQDFIIGCADLTMEERGQYITLLCLQHQKGHISEKTIKLIVPNISADVLKKFIQDSAGNFYNERLALEAQKRTRFTESRRKNLTSDINYDSHMDLHMDSHSDIKSGSHMDSHMENENENEYRIQKTVNEKESLKEQKIRLLNQRKQLFEIKVLEYRGEYPDTMLRNFFDYWAEMNKSCSQMRWEMERTWELKRRLRTWADRDKGFSKPADLITYEKLVQRFNNGETDIWQKYEKTAVAGKTKPMWKLKQQ